MNNWIEKPKAAYRHSDDGVVLHTITAAADGMWSRDTFDIKYISKKVAMLAVERDIETQRLNAEYGRRAEEIRSQCVLESWKTLPAPKRRDGVVELFLFCAAAVAGIVVGALIVTFSLGWTP